MDYSTVSFPVSADAPRGVPFTRAERAAVKAFARKVRRHGCRLDYCPDLEPLTGTVEAVSVIRKHGNDRGEEGAAFIVWPVNGGAALMLNSMTGQVATAVSVAAALDEAKTIMSRPDVGWKASWSCHVPPSKPA